MRSDKRFLDLPALPDETHYDDPPPTTAKQLHRAIGKTGHVNLGFAGGQLTLLVGVVDVRRCYGRLDYLVAPMDDESSGEVWIEAGRFRPE